MRKTTTLLLFLGLLSVTANAQMLKKKDRFSIMPFVGASYLLGDLIPYGGGTNNAKTVLTELPNAAKLTRPSVGVFLGYRFHPKLTLRGGVTWMMYAESDRDFARNRNRGLESTGHMTELNVHLVYDLIGRRTSREWSRWSPYLLAGVGVVYAQSSVKIDGVTDAASLARWRATFDIYNRIEEGGHVSIVIPVGIGARYELTRGVDLHLEFITRYTPTDLLDGVEDFVDRQNDWFLTAQVGVTYQLSRQNALFCPKPKARKAKKFLLF